MPERDRDAKAPFDQTVEVTFDPNADPQFDFVPDPARMTAAGKIILIQHPASATWRFRGATIKDDDLGEFTVKVFGNGNALHIDDKCRQRREYPYNVTITTADDETITSPDPVIVNDPGR